MSRKRVSTRRYLRLEPLEDRRLLSAGDLDLSFGASGLVTTNLGTNNNAFPNGVAVYHNDGAVNEGKIVAVGYADNGTVRNNNRDIAVTRYNPNGSLDTTFNGSGKVITDFGS